MTLEDIGTLARWSALAIANALGGIGVLSLWATWYRPDVFAGYAVGLLGAATAITLAANYRRAG